MISAVIPVYNEEKILENNVLKLSDFFKKNYPNNFKITMSDNASTDKTPEIAKKLVERFPEIVYLRLNKKGKGLAISEGWKKFPADVYLFLDADLSCDLSDVDNVIKEVTSGTDIACGSRNVKNSNDKRPLARRIISKLWNLVPKLVTGTKLTDTACGIKAVNQKTINEILPKIKNYNWFFDTELVLKAERNGFKIKEIPVTWVECGNRKSKVDFLRVAAEYLKNLWSLRRHK